jgi:Response regulator containing CheY-like receiver and SARP domains
MKAIIVDDELPLLHEFEKMLKQHTQIEVVGAYTDPSEALKDIVRTRPDMAFLDIEMSEFNGIELANRILSKQPDVDIFFVTAYNHFATEAFDTDAVDYILKPVRPDRLQKALERRNKKRGENSKVDKALLRIQSFGKFGVFYGDQAIKWSRSKQRELMAYLLQNEGRWIDKYKICDDLWRDSIPDQALAGLQTAVWALRKVLKDFESSGIKIEYANDSYILSLKEAKWDIKEFNTAAKTFTETGNREFGEKALNIYKDGYLFCEDWNWAVLEREKFTVRQNKMKKALERKKNYD